MLTLKFEKPIIGIYCITNSVDGKIYIGSSKNVRKRIANHAYHLRRGSHRNYYMQNAFNKYGEESFAATMLEFIPDNTTDDNIIQIEQKYLDKMQPFKDKGYNIEPIADRFGIAEETRKKLSDARIKAWANRTQSMIDGIKKSVETQKANGCYERMSQLRKNKKRTNIDLQKLSESISKSDKCIAFREKLAKQRKGSKRSQAEKLKIKLAHSNPIMQIDKDGVALSCFLSLRDMRLATGFAPCEIAKVCKGITECYPKSLGYKWKYLDF